MGPAWIRGGMGVLQTLAPETAARAATHLFFRTRRMPFQPETRALFDRAAPLLVPFQDQRIAAWSWGRGPTVVLSHGWNGRATQLAPFVEPLLERGHRVVAFDHIGHGASTGDSSSFPEMGRAVAAVARASGGADAVIAHSLGAASLALALHDGAIDAERVVLISSPASALPWLGLFRSVLGLRDPAFENAKRRIEARAGRKIEELEVTELAADLEVDALLVHDVGDRQVPVASSRAIHAAWRGSELFETEGLGHNRILKSPDVVRAAQEFVTG